MDNRKFPPGRPARAASFAALRNADEPEDAKSGWGAAPASAAEKRPATARRGRPTLVAVAPEPEPEPEALAEATPDTSADEPAAEAAAGDADSDAATEPAQPARETARDEEDGAEDARASHHHVGSRPSNPGATDVVLLFLRERPRRSVPP